MPLDEGIALGIFKRPSCLFLLWWEVLKLFSLLLGAKNEGFPGWLAQVHSVGEEETQFQWSFNEV